MLKKLTLIVAGLMAAMLLGVTLILLPAHLDIRKIRPPLPDVASLRALTGSIDKPIRVSAILSSSQNGPGTSIGHHTIVLEWADGRLFLIDAGMDESASLEFGKLMETLWSSDPADFHTTAFAALGARAERVAAVGFTHLHFDHTQGIQAACAERPRFRVLQSIHQASVHNIHTKEGAGIVESCPRGAAVDAASLVEVAGFPGLALYSLGGHTPGSTLFAVALGNKVLLFPGDITNSRADLLEDRGKGFLYSYLIVPEDTTRTRELRAWLRSLHGEPDMQVFVSHDLADMRELNQLGMGG